jgi:hypothetical protein
LLIAFRAGVEQDEAGNGIVELRELLAEDGAERGADERRPWLVAAIQQVDRLEVFRLAGLHRADDGQLVGDAGAARHQFAEMHSGQRGSNGAKWPAAGSARFGIPCFKLARRAAQPQQDAVLLLALRFFGDRGDVEQSAEAEHRRGAGGQGALQEEPPMQFVLGTAARGLRCLGHGKLASG